MKMPGGIIFCIEDGVGSAACIDGGVCIYTWYSGTQEELHCNYTSTEELRVAHHEIWSQPSLPQSKYIVSPFASVTLQPYFTALT